MKNLNKRKALAAKVLGVGKNRIVFRDDSLAEIKEAITKQDIRDFYEQGIIIIKEIKGRKTHVKRKTRRGFGKRKMIIKKGKKEYVILTRKLRNHLRELKKQQKLDSEEYKNLRTKIKSRAFKNKAHLKGYMGAKE